MNARHISFQGSFKGSPPPPTSSVRWANSDEDKKRAHIRIPLQIPVHNIKRGSGFILLWVPWVPPPAPTAELLSSHGAEQLLLQNVFSLLILFRALIGTVVFPSHNVFALSTPDVPDDVAARRHIPLASFALLDVDDVVEEVGFAMLTAEVLV